MRFGLLLPLALLATPALSDPYEGSGYLLGCNDEMCGVWSAGVVLLVAKDGPTPAAILDALQGMDPLSAVQLSAELGEMGDMTVSAALTALARVTDDPYEETLRFIQGEWRPRGEESPFSIRIDGLEWTEMGAEGSGDAFLISPGATCADGVEPGGIALSLVMIGGDP